MESLERKPPSPQAISTLGVSLPSPQSSSRVSFKCKNYFCEKDYDPKFAFAFSVLCLIFQMQKSLYTNPNVQTRIELCVNEWLIDWNDYVWFKKRMRDSFENQIACIRGL